MKEILKRAAIRSLYTIGEVILATIPTTAKTLGDVDWLLVVSSSLLAGVLSFIKSLLVGMPEIEEKVEDEEIIG